MPRSLCNRGILWTEPDLNWQLPGSIYLIFSYQVGLCLRHAFSFRRWILVRSLSRFHYSASLYTF